VLGSRTYEHALQLGWPYGDTPTFVITNRELPSTRTSVEFYSGDLHSAVNQTIGIVPDAGPNATNPFALNAPIFADGRLLVDHCSVFSRLHAQSETAALRSDNERPAQQRRLAITRRQTRSNGAIQISCITIEPASAATASGYLQTA
jgi:hypothetical protein